MNESFILSLVKLEKGMAFLTKEQLAELGFKSFGDNVLISEKASIYSPDLMSIGSNVRVDDFCILSGCITLGSYIHIGAYSALYGKYGIVMEDFTGLSPRCTVFSASDDFSGEFLISPMVSPNLYRVTGGEIHIKKYSQIGAGTIILPNSKINEGVAVGSMSLVNYELKEWGIYAGIPVKRIKERNNNCKSLSEKIINKL